MKKSIRQAIILAMVMILAVTSTALADTIVSSSFKFNSVMEQPEETPTVEPEAEPTEELAAEPTEEVVEEPAVTEEPAVEPTEEIVEEPVVTEEPVAEPTEEVVEEPVVTEEPAVEFNEEVVEETTTTEEPVVETTEEVAEDPAVTEEPVAEPAEEPTAEPLPEITATITSNLGELETVGVGTEMILTLTVEGNEGYAYTVQWQKSTDGVNWQDIEGANGDQFRLILAKEHSGVYWRATVDLVDPAAAE